MKVNTTIFDDEMKEIIKENSQNYKVINNYETEANITIENLEKIIKYHPNRIIALKYKFGKINIMIGDYLE